MKVLMINSVCGIGSTGRICTDIANLLLKAGHECKIVYGRGKAPDGFQHAVRYSSNFSIKVNALLARIFDNEGFNAKRSTKKIIRLIEGYNPDIIHLHNLHGYFLNVPILFNYLKRKFKGKIFWSLYDCWSFTGHCAHFDFVRCGQWETGCQGCAYRHRYPKSVGVSRSRSNYIKKKKHITGLTNLEIIVPSRWLDGIVSRSFLKDYQRMVLPNGIDIGKFYPFIEDDNLQLRGIDRKKFIILGVSNFWTETKGVEYFVKLAQDLPGNKYQVVLVGNMYETKLPSNILHIPATNNIQELCALYTVADVFVNPTLQETQGLTTIEAFACGTPAIVFNSGGAAECVDQTCGIALQKGDYQGLIKTIAKMQSGEIRFQKEDCIRVSKKYDAEKIYREFVSLYEESIRR